jgi:hypothetical protein
MIRKEYKSVEMKILDSVMQSSKNVREGTKDLCKYFAQNFYGLAISPYRIPTLIRKLANKQTYYQREQPFNDDKPDHIVTGALIGTISGLYFNLLNLKDIYNHTSNGNIVPLSILILANSASVMYELGRKSGFKKSKLEYVAKSDFKTKK